jgi:hypothetical protein
MGIRKVGGTDLGFFSDGPYLMELKRSFSRSFSWQSLVKIMQQDPQDVPRDVDMLLAVRFWWLGLPRW